MELEDSRPYTSGKGRLDVNGVEWFACDPYPTWYRRNENGRVIEANPRWPACEEGGHE